MLSVSDFAYHLPPELIAQHPAEPRDHSRLMVVDRNTSAITHQHFYDLPSLLRPGDVLVRNNTKVIPARLVGHKTTGGKMELLLLHRESLSTKGERWTCLTRPGIKVGQIVHFGDMLTATCLELRDYERLVEFNLQGPALMQALYEVGHTPIPPYIKWNTDDEAALREKYQTMYAKFEGSAAAPTAGLHFTPEVETALLGKNVTILEVTLHVGLGTFLPLTAEQIAKGVLHEEWYEVTSEVAQQLTAAKKAGQRIVAVGTTTCRVLETCAEVNESTKTTHFAAKSGQTNIFIHPPYRFKAVDALITNFHLPESSLLMLVSALATTPNTVHPFTAFADISVGKAYTTAVAEQYRFFSFGDAMLIK